MMKNITMTNHKTGEIIEVDFATAEDEKTLMEVLKGELVIWVVEGTDAKDIQIIGGMMIATKVAELAKYAQAV